MDIRDYESEVGKDFFWFRAKVELIGVLLRRLDSDRGRKILDIGAGTGDDLAVIAGVGDVYAVDSDPKCLNLVPDELVAEKRCADACDLPYEESFFDLVVAFDVLEHIEDDERAIGEIHRVLKPGKSFVFTVPAFDWLFSSHDRALGHFRRYDKKTARRLLSAFRCVKLGYWMFSLFGPVAIHRLLKRRDANPKVSYPRLPLALNELFYRVLDLDTKLIEHGYTLPFGTSLFGICTK